MRSRAACPRACKTTAPALPDAPLPVGVGVEQRRLDVRNLPRQQRLLVLDLNREGLQQQQEGGAGRLPAGTGNHKLLFRLVKPILRVLIDMGKTTSSCTADDR